MKRRLGKSGLEVSALGLGCWAIGGPWEVVNDETGERYPAGWGQIDDAESIRAIHAGLDAGINFFDTAANYGCGHSETVLGKALNGRRDRVVIATKFGHLIDEEKKEMRGDNDAILGNIRRDCENSLRRLNTDYIDIYQLHEAAYEPERAPDVMAVLEELVKEGKIRWYGWSTDFADRARIFAEGEHCTAIQFGLNAIYDRPNSREVCTTFDLAGINKDPLNKGILTGKFNASSTFPTDDIRHRVDFSEGRFAERLTFIEALREVLTTGGRTMAQGALAYIWTLDERMVPIPGFKSVAQVEQNAAAMGFGMLSDEQMRQIEQIKAELPAGLPPETRS